MRLDVALVERGLARSRNQAAQLIASGKVEVKGQPVTKAAMNVNPADELSVLEQAWVSRSAHKLIGALADSGIQVPQRVLDAGASTGGFTQVCLAEGADQVYAVDVGHNQLAQELRDDSRVCCIEGLNLRDLTLEHLEDEPVELVVADVSFISLKLLLAPLFSVLSHDGTALLMVKPQFEVGRDLLQPGGVVTDPRLQQQSVAAVREVGKQLGWHSTWQGESKLPGTNGNREFFIKFQPDESSRLAVRSRRR